MASPLDSILRNHDNNVMSHTWKRILNLFICTWLFSTQSFAQSTNYLNIPRFENKFSGTEYISGNTPGTVLMKVNLWGAVNRPGIHHVPVNTDLMSLMSYAGGPTSKAILDEVTIKRDLGKKRKLIRIDVEELVGGVSHHHVELAPNDIVVIPASEPLISQDTVTMITLISVVASTVLAFVLIDQRND